MDEKFRKFFDQSGACGGSLTDLVKAFDYLHHELLIATLQCTRFRYVAVKTNNSTSVTS